jgi:hypothetical protein
VTIAVKNSAAIEKPVELIPNIRDKLRTASYATTKPLITEISSFFFCIHRHRELLIEVSCNYCVY